MTHTPPVPKGNQSPYPIAEPPHTARPADEPPPAERSQPDAGAGLVVGLAVGAVAVLGALGLAGYLFGRKTPDRVPTSRSPTPTRQRKASRRATPTAKAKPSVRASKSKPAATATARPKRARKPDSEAGTGGDGPDKA